MALLAGREGAAGAPRHPFDLAGLVAPADRGAFLTDHWERRSLHIARDDPGYYASLLTFADVDRIISLTSVRSGDLQVVRDGREVPIAALGSAGGRRSESRALEALYEHYRDGYTIVLNALHSRWEPLRVLTSVLGAELGARLQVNVYVTPAGTQGFKPHHDTHDVFVAQIHGSKRWRLYGSPIALPLDSQAHDPSSRVPEVEQEIELHAGDLLYLPRGTIHSAAANSTAAVHLAIGVRPVLWSEVISQAVTRVFEEDVRFRRGLPIGFAADDAELESTLTGLLDVLRSRLDPSRIAVDAAKRSTLASSTSLPGHLVDLERLGELSVETKVKRRENQLWHILVSEDVVELDFHDKTVRLPATVSSEVRYVAESPPDGFTPAAIPGDLDDAGRLVLISTLIREGFLTFA